MWDIALHVLRSTEGRREMVRKWLAYLFNVAKTYHVNLINPAAMGSLYCMVEHASTLRDPRPISSQVVEDVPLGDCLVYEWGLKSVRRTQGSSYVVEWSDSLEGDKQQDRYTCCG